MTKAKDESQTSVEPKGRDIKVCFIHANTLSYYM